MTLSSLDDFIARVGAGYWKSEPLWGEATTTSLSIWGGFITNVGFHRLADFPTLPSLPSGVTAYIVTRFAAEFQSVQPHSCVLARMTDLGSLNIAGPTFTDGSAMPTVTELGQSRQTPGLLIAEVSTAISAVPGNMTVTYVDQDGHTAETTAAFSLPASCPAKAGAIVQLNDGDFGVLDVTNATRTGGTTPTGVIQLWGITIVGWTTSQDSNLETVMLDNLGVQDFNIQRLPAGARLGGFWIAEGTNRGAMMGEVFIVGDS